LCFIKKKKDPETDAEPKCCDKKPNQRHSACWPVEIPSEDPFYSNFGRRCMEFVRSGSGLTENCKLGLFPMTHTKKKRLDNSFSRSVPFIPRPTASAFFSLERAKQLVHEPVSRIAFNKRITKSISCHSRHNER
jgi:hypothetical protein